MATQGRLAPLPDDRRGPRRAPSRYSHLTACVAAIGYVPAPSMRIGVPKETAAGEHRVALVPEVVSKLKAKGLDISVQNGAGDDALLPDDAFAEAGAERPLRRGGDLGLRRRADDRPARPGGRSARLGASSILIGFLAPLSSPQTTRALSDAGATAFAMEAIPRISRAQSMDALSSQTNVAGYRAALLGAEEMGRFYPMLMTAAGTIPPAKVLVLGVGVAGLQALATAKRLGARTTGYDVRPEVAEQVQSLGAQWLDLGLEASGEGGYARELTDEERARQQQALTDAIKGFDVVITTALVPGRPAPRLVTAEAVAGMKPGSVIVDLAGETGGNCELTEPGRDRRARRGEDRLAAEPAGERWPSTPRSCSRATCSRCSSCSSARTARCTGLRRRDRRRARASCATARSSTRAQRRPWKGRQPAGGGLS